MARPLEAGLTTDLSVEQAPTIDEKASGRLDRAAVRAFAAAISSLIIATLVVSQSARALEPEGTLAGNSFEAGTITLVDDDQGRSLVSLSDMAPGRPVIKCITVSYEGTILPVDVSLAASTDGPLADYLEVVIESGTGGGFGSCDTFVPDATIYSGTVGVLSRANPMPVGTLRNQDDDISFRFRFELVDDGRAVGESTSLDFVWEAVPA